MPSILETLHDRGQQRPIISMRDYFGADPQVCADIVERYDRNESLDSIASDYQVVRNTVKRALLREGITIRQQYRWVEGEVPRGPDHWSWKSGRHLKEGYVIVLLTPDHPFISMATAVGRKSRYVLEHRLRMAEYLGRPLESHETVHHKNGVTDDNRIENLELRNGHHGRGQVWECRQCGSHDVTPIGLA